MGIDNRILSNDEVLRSLSEKATAQGDSFKVKISRRQQQGSLNSNHVANFEDANLLQLASAEEWLPQLAGGGPYYNLEVYHHTDPVIAMGRLNFNIDGEPRRPDPLASRMPNWKGPRRCTAPASPETATSSTVFNSSSVAPPPASPQNSLAPGGPPGAIQAGDDPRVASALARLEVRERDMEARQHRAEMESLKREYESKLQLFSVPKESGIEKLATSLAPVLTEILRGNQEMRMAALKSQEASQHAALEAQKQIAASNAEMMKLAFSRPAVDPAVQGMLDKFEKMVTDSRTNQRPDGDMVAQMADAFGRMTRTTLQLVHAAAEMRMGDAPPQDHPMLQVMKEATKAVQAISDGYRASVVGKTKSPEQQGLAQLEQQLLPGGTPAASTPPVAAAPASAAAATPPAAGQAAAPAKLKKTIVDLLEERIRAKAPPAQIAEDFVKALGTPDMEAELQRHNGSVADLFGTRLGQEWLNESPTNAIYADQLLGAISAEADRQGVFKNGPVEEDAIETGATA